MNLSKQNKLLKKQNEKLMEEINAISLEFKELKHRNSETEKYAEGLIRKLDKVKSDWEDALEELDAQRDKYSRLINEIRECRDGMVRKSNSVFKRF